MGSIGAPEILVVLVVALLVLGPKRLPDAARSVGRAVSEFRRVSSGIQDELRQSLSEPAPSVSTAVPEPPRDWDVAVEPDLSSMPAPSSTSPPASNGPEGAARPDDEPLGP